MSVDVSEPEMDEWATLWAQAAGGDERQRLRQLAARTSRRAQLLELADLSIGVLIAAGVLAALVLRPEPVTLAVGLVAAAGLVWSSWDRYVLKVQVRQLVEVHDRLDLVGLQTKRARIDLQRSAVSLVATLPVLLLFALLTHSIEEGGSLAGFGQMLWEAVTDVPVGPAIMAGIATLLFQQARSVQSRRRQLRQLERISGQYRHENRLDELAFGGPVRG